MRATTKAGLGVVTISALALAGCAPSPGGASTNTDGGGESVEVSVGMLTSLTGPLGAYGEAYQAGFEAGLDYATDGTGVVDGVTLNIDWIDDQGNPDTAVSKAKEIIGTGTSIIAGTASSGIATALAEQAQQNDVLFVSGPAATDAVTGINENTFRSGRQTYQDVATAGTFLGDVAGRTVTVFAQDTTFGQGNVAAVEAVLGAQGAEVSSILVAEDATEFTPFAQQIMQATPDLVFVAWAGATSGAMWESLGQQGVLDATTVVTGLGDTSTYQAYGSMSDKITFLNHYFPGATDNEVAQAMDAHLAENGHAADLFTVDGFAAAQMIVHAVSEGQGDVAVMRTALEGWTFDSVKGEITVRAEDHALIQPMFEVRLVAGPDGQWVPELVNTVDAETVAPPVAG